MGNRLNSVALSVGLLIPLSLLFLGYVQLRDWKVNLCWFFLAIGMLLFYCAFKDNASMQLKRGTALKSFKSLFGFLIVFQLGRWLFRNFLGREYVTPSLGGRSDLLEGIEPQLADYILFGVLFTTIIAAQGW